MELFHKAKAVRLRSRHDKYLIADEDEETVCQGHNGSSRRARWSVEFIEGSNFLRLKSCYGNYLTASNQAFLVGVTGKKVLQTLPKVLDSSAEWEPIRDGFLVKLKNRHGKFLRANGGPPPWRNTVTHNVPLTSSHQDWVLWEVDIVEILVGSEDQSPKQDVSQSPLDSRAFEGTPDSLTLEMSQKLSKQQSSDSFTVSPSSKGRTICFVIADDNGNVDDAFEESFFTFNGSSVDELTHKLEEITEMNDIIVCSRSPLNGKLYPLRLHLPPNNTKMHVIVVKSTSKVAKGLQG